jgi:histidinol-phosphate aminotransferase/imidazoleglycerol-phosphate dehydratase/histidinol-phosphatase
MTSILSRVRPDILAMKEYSSARSLYKKQQGIIFLDANECPYEPYIGAEGLSRYPGQQPQELTDALCRLYDVSSKNMAITRGADEAIDILMRAFCTPGQDNIVICPPTFAMYEHSAGLQGTKVKKAPLTESFSLDIDLIMKTADETTKLVFVCSPNNPTANLMNVKDIKNLCEALRNRALIVVDETYIEFAGENFSLIREIENYQNLVILRTLSKSYAAAGLRCGCAIAQQDIIKLTLKILPPYPLPQPVIKEAVRILQPKSLMRLAQKRAEVLGRKEKFINDLRTLPEIMEIFPSRANFILIRVRDAQDFTQKCLTQNIIVRNQSHQPGLENCIRISMGLEEEMERLMAVLKGETFPQAEQRTATVNRKTNETSIAVSVNLDQIKPVHINTGLPFYNHMLEQLAKHGGFSLVLECEGDLEIEAHHTVEDCAIALGQALKTALDDKRGVGRYGSSELIVPMDEAQARVSLDLGGRFYLAFKADFPDSYVGNCNNPLPKDMIEHIFRSLAENLQATLHIAVTGENSHHMVEACFKGFARALRQAMRREGQELPSTKGML